MNPEQSIGIRLLMADDLTQVVDFPHLARNNNAKADLPVGQWNGRASAFAKAMAGRGAEEDKDLECLSSRISVLHVLRVLRAGSRQFLPDSDGLRRAPECVTANSPEYATLAGLFHRDSPEYVTKKMCFRTGNAPSRLAKLAKPPPRGFYLFLIVLIVDVDI